jgi:hypothetical protein
MHGAAMHGSSRGSVQVKYNSSKKILKIEYSFCQVLGACTVRPCTRVRAALRTKGLIKNCAMFLKTLSAGTHSEEQKRALYSGFTQ